MRTYEYKSITEGHKGADTRHDDDPGTSAEGNQQVGSVLDYSVGHPYRDPESVQYHENTGRRYAGGGRDLCRPYQRGTTGDNNDRIRTRMQLSAVFSGIYPGAEAAVYQPACGSLWNGQRQADRLQRYLLLMTEPIIVTVIILRDPCRERSWYRIP